jgi:methionine sulfoxide reductase heme-binding subunit
MQMPQLLLLLRLSARTSAALFFCGFSGVSLARLWPGTFTRWMGRTAPRFILAFVASHSVHLALIVYGGLTFAAFREILKPVVIIGGGTVYVLIYLLAAITVLRLRGRVPGRGVARLESFVLYLVWMVFALIGVHGAIVSRGIYVPWAVAALGALAVRLAALRLRTPGGANADPREGLA